MFTAMIRMCGNFVMKFGLTLCTVRTCGIISPVSEYQHDGATPHTAHICRQHLQTNNISVLDWPSKSPDLSVIENLWDYLGQRVRDQQNPPQTVAALAAALRQEWRAIPQQYIRGLFNSMRRRLTACIRAQGGHTGY